MEGKQDQRWYEKGGERRIMGRSRGTGGGEEEKENEREDKDEAASEKRCRRDTT